MNQNSDTPISAEEPYRVELSAKDLPVFCPNPAMPLWNHHPRVFLDLGQTGVAKCPYCGTEYRLKPGTVLHAH